MRWFLMVNDFRLRCSQRFCSRTRLCAQTLTRVGALSLTTITVARPDSPFGVVEVTDEDRVTGFSEGGRIPYWVSCGVYVLGEEALDRFPERGDHESTTFPELAQEGALHAFRHDGLWLTVNTPKELRRAQEHVTAHPEWLEAQA